MDLAEPEPPFSLLLVRYSTRVKLRCRMLQYQGRGIEASVGTGTTTVWRILVRYSRVVCQSEFMRGGTVGGYCVVPVAPYQNSILYRTVPIRYMYTVFVSKRGQSSGAGSKGGQLYK